MKKMITQKSKRLNIGEALIFCGVVLAMYYIFRSPELEREIGKVEGKLSR